MPRLVTPCPVRRGVVAMAALLLGACAGNAPDTPPGNGAPHGTGTGGAGGPLGTAGGSGGALGTAGGAGGPLGGAGTGAGAPGGMGGLAGSAGSRAPDAGVADSRPGTGGSAGATAAGSCQTAGATFCSDFEDSALPAVAMFFPEYLRAQAGMYISIDSTVARGGARSVKVTGAQFSQMLGVPTPGDRFWVRLYLRSDTDIQQGHNTYVAAVEGNGDPNMGQAVRIGEHQCQLELNRKSDDKELLSNGGMYSCTGGVKLVANRWYCLEALFDGAGGEVRVFVDAQEIPQLHATGWGPYGYKLFKFGFEKYHGQNKTLWYDDVAVATVRIGCLP